MCRLHEFSFSLQATLSVFMDFKLLEISLCSQVSLVHRMGAIGLNCGFKAILIQEFSFKGNSQMKVQFKQQMELGFPVWILGFLSSSPDPLPYVPCPSPSPSS